MFKKGCQGMGSFVLWSSCAGHGKGEMVSGDKTRTRGGFVHVVGLVMGKDEIVGGDRTCHS